MDYRMYKFVKDFEVKGYGVIPKGTELTIFEGRVLVNNGLPWPSTVPILKRLLSEEEKRPHFLRKKIIPYNKV
jgi:hypothetical protein